MSGTSGTIYRQDPVKSAIGIIGVRSRANNFKTRRYNTSARTPAWMVFNGDGMTVSSSKGGFPEIYTNGPFKIGPIATALSVKHGGDGKMLITLSAQINCFTKADFERVEKAFGPTKKISISFGYAKSYIKGEEHSAEFKEMYVATYEFSTSDDGVWEYKFTAVAPGLGIFDMSMIVGVWNPGSKKSFKTKDGNIPVAGIQHLIAYHAQRNGNKTIDEIEDGTVFKITENGGGHVAIWDPRHLVTNLADKYITRPLSNLFNSDEITKTQNQVYVSLEYIVETLFNNNVKKVHKSKSNDIPEKLEIKFHPRYSYSYVPVGKNFRSAWPNQVLFIGREMGNYYTKFYTEGGSDGQALLEDRCKSSQALNCTKELVGGRQKIDIKKILIHRDVVSAALETSTAEKSGKDNQTTETSKIEMTINAFFKTIFNAINMATGGWIKLTLAMVPDTIYNDNEKYKLYVVDENNGWCPDPIQCYVFDPIDGDGNTLKCSLQSDAGSNEYKTAVFMNTSPVSKVVGTAEGKGKEIKKSMEAQQKEAKDKLYKLFRDPGSIAGKEFDSTECSVAEQQLGLLKETTPDYDRMDMLIYPGIKMELEIYGTYGFIPGNAIMSTQLPDTYSANGVYFWVSEVEHTINDKSEWTTKISALQTIAESKTGIKYNPV